MLKISEMAKLANTTRRTLIFYDQENIFKPYYKNDAGYRYYLYDQLYDLMFILGLRNLQIPLNDIKQIESGSKNISRKQLANTQNKIDKKLDELEKIKNVLEKKIIDYSILENITLYDPKIETRVKTIFLCSNQTVSCTEDEVAQLFSEFYKQLGSLAAIDTNRSGFLTKLSVNNPNGYSDAAFRIIKEPLEDKQKRFIPIVEKTGGNYASILVENNLVGITHGLSMLENFCKEKDVKTADYLWQINHGNMLLSTGSSEFGWLEFFIPEENDDFDS